MSAPEIAKGDAQFERGFRADLGRVEVVEGHLEVNFVVQSPARLGPLQCLPRPTARVSEWRAWTRSRASLFKVETIRSQTRDHQKCETQPITGEDRRASCSSVCSERTGRRHEDERGERAQIKRKKQGEKGRLVYRLRLRAHHNTELVEVDRADAVEVELGHDVRHLRPTPSSSHRASCLSRAAPPLLSLSPTLLQR
eukprot:2485355-Rhodomonas_salina.1